MAHLNGKSTPALICKVFLPGFFPLLFPCTWADTWPYHFRSLMALIHLNNYWNLWSLRLSWFSHSCPRSCLPTFPEVWVSSSNCAKNALPGLVSGTETTMSHSSSEVTHKAGTLACLVRVRGTQEWHQLETLVSLVQSNAITPDSVQTTGFRLSPPSRFPVYFPQTALLSYV